MRKKLVMIKKIKKRKYRNNKTKENETKGNGKNKKTLKINANLGKKQESKKSFDLLHNVTFHLSRS